LQAREAKVGDASGDAKDSAKPIQTAVVSILPAVSAVPKPVQHDAVATSERRVV